MSYPTRRSFLFGLAFAPLWLIGTPAQAQNLVLNPGFETGDWTDWDISQVLSGTTVVAKSGFGFGSRLSHSGTYFALLGATSDTGPDTFSQIIHTTPGRTYNVGFWLASDGFTPNLFQATFGNATVLNKTDIGAQNYTYYSSNVTATSNAMKLAFTSLNDSGYLSLDDISVAAVPEASMAMTFSLTLVSGAGLLLRRRRGQSATENGE